MENFIVSARKYRPASFDTVIGQRSITSTLRNAILNRQLAQAYLFCGPRGVGKTTCARIFAKTINCMNPQPNAEPCNECESCKAFNSGRSLNIHELDAASNNSVDDIRGLVDQVRILPQVGKYSVYIIDEVHMLSASAFNAFLKTLEEPPAHAIFILATTEKHKILPTILSRCQIYDFSRIKVPDTIEHLKRIAAKEGIQAEEEALNVIAQKADGAMRDALSIFDQVVSFCGKDLTYDKVIENLNVLDYDYYFKLTDLFRDGKVAETLLLFNEIMEKGFDAGNLISGLGRHFRDLLVAKEEVTVQLLEVSASIKERYLKQAKTVTPEFIFDALKVIEQCEIQYKMRVEKRLCVELTLIKLCQINELKKKSLSIEEFTGLLKIANFNGKFQQSGGVTTASVVGEMPSVPAGKTNVYKAEPPRSFKLKMAMAETREDQRIQQEEGGTKVEDNRVKAQCEFTVVDVVSALENYVATSLEDTTIKIALTSHAPQVQGFVITLEVDNDILLSKMMDIHPYLLSFLSKKLNNGFITLNVQVYTEPESGEEKRRLFTAKDKFDHFVEINPAVSELKTLFGLEIE